MKNRYLLSAIASFGLTAGAASAAPAPRFLQDAVSGDNAEIALGRLAQQRGTSRGVVEFGRTLEADHSTARTEALQAARDLRVRVRSDAIKPDGRALERRLSRFRGDRFDREFVAAMAAEHRRDIAMFKAQQRTGDRVTSRLAAATLPHLQHHLDMALALQRRR